MGKLVTAQRPFTMLTPGLTGGSDPSRGVAGNPVKVRESYRIQMFPEVAGRGDDRNDGDPSTPGLTTRQGLATFTTADTFVASTGQITVAAATTPAVESWIQIGEYKLVTDYDFTVVNADTATTATNLATAINELPGFTAAGPAGSVITFTGPAGPGGNDIVFLAGGGSPAMFTLAPATGTLQSAEPVIGPPSIS